MREYLTCNIKTELNIKRPLASSLTRTFLFPYYLFFSEMHHQITGPSVQQFKYGTQHWNATKDAF